VPLDPVHRREANSRIIDSYSAAVPDQTRATTFPETESWAFAWNCARPRYQAIARAISEYAVKTTRIGIAKRWTTYPAGFCPAGW
jgi:hypothetical protein